LIWFIDKVWPLILDSNQNVTFHIAGKNAPKWLIMKIESANNTIFFGEVENSTDFIQKYEVAVVPLFSGSGMRVKVVELMLNQVAIVSTQKGIEGIANNICDYTLVSNDPKQFAEFVIQLQNNSELASKINLKHLLLLSINLMLQSIRKT